MGNKYLLETKNIEKRFGGVHALKGVSVNIKKGEILGLVGENGAGKSTLIKIISGVHQPDKGEIFYGGEKVKFGSPIESIQAGISTVYQELSLVPHRTVAQNIYCLREPINKVGIIDWKTLNKNTEKLLAELDVSISPKSLIYNLSIADQQIVEIVKAISMGGKILIMDEPTSALSEEEINQLFKLMKKICASGHTILFVSHKIEEIFKITNRIIVMRDGAMVGNLVTKETTLDKVVEFMVGRKLDNMYPEKIDTVGDKILSVENFTYGNKFKDVEFDLRKGEILGVFGPIGSGRTELVKAICGLGEKDSGDLYIEGQKENMDLPSKAIKEGIVYMTEDRINEGIFYKLSVRDNFIASSLRTFSEFGILNFRKIQEQAKKMINLLHIVTPGIHTNAISLSGGNQQKVLLSRALLATPKVLIADEPTRGIDVGAKVEIYSWLRKLASDGVAIIMVSCELPEILGITDRIMVMYSGKVKAILETSKTNEKEVWEYCFSSNQ